MRCRHRSASVGKKQPIQVGSDAASSSSRKRRKQQNALMAKLKACAKREDLEEAAQIHAQISAQGLLEDDIYFSNALIHLYARCGALARAIEVFEGARFRDSITWNAMVSAYTRHGFDRDAMGCFDGMRREGIARDAVTYACILKACGSGARSARIGKAIHAEILRNDMLDDHNVFIGSSLVDMYGKFGELAAARRVFDELRSRNSVCWNALLSGYVRCGRSEDALACFERMKREGLSPDPVTLVCVLKACGDANAVEKGREIHGEILRLGLLETDAFLGTAVLDMYAKCGEFSKAMEVLEQLPSNDRVPWNSLIAGYVQHNRCEEAVECYDRMMNGEGVSPDAVTFVCVLKACSGMGAVGKGEEIHAESARRGLLLGRNAAPIVGNALVDMYAKSGEVAKAREVFDGLPVRDVVSWTALIAGYAQHGRAEEALDCFRNMQLEGPEPNAVTYVCALGACASLGAIGRGEAIHGEIIRAGLLVEEEENAVLGNALVDMYAKCGALCKAQNVFDRLLARDIVSWNALITGYAQIGKDKIAELFERMVGEGVDPDRVTFIVMLNACSDLGMLEKGQLCFARMTSDYGLVPTFEHYACMVDAFGRAGHFGNALQVVEKMPMSDYLPIWTSLLGACQKWGAPELGLVAFEHAISLDAKHVATYVCMRNICIGAKMHDCADVIDAMRMENCIWGEEPSWIDVS